ncbi:MAG: hypothetical protein HY608_00320 [Planctomycetes bacterium]|nr:hypothetical protein [Planctomycetota bacterium]
MNKNVSHVNGGARDTRDPKEDRAPPRADDPEFQARFLEEIHANPMSRYAELARRMGVSVGLIATFMRKCAEREFLDVRQLSAKKFVYLLTPKGVMAMMARHYSKFSRNLDFFFGLTSRIHAVLGEMSAKGVHEILLWVDDREKEGKLHNWVEVIDPHLKSHRMRLLGVVARGGMPKEPLGCPVHITAAQIRALRLSDRQGILVVRSWYEDHDLLQALTPNLFGLTEESIQVLQRPGEALLQNLGIRPA